MQSISLLEFRRTKARAQGPFLVVAPLTTLGHWRREVEAWTDMNVVCFMGSAADRQVIMDHEIFWRNPPAACRPGLLGQKSRTPKLHVLLTSFEILRDCATFFNSFLWDVVIVDEAHRLKALHSATRCVGKSNSLVIPSACTIQLSSSTPQLGHDCSCFWCVVLLVRQLAGLLLSTGSENGGDGC
jgi:hypothetical protein